MELVSTFFESETLTNVARGLGKLGCRIDNRSPKVDKVRAIMEDLTERGVLRHDPHYTVSPERAHVVMLELARSGRLKQMSEVVRQLRPPRQRSADAISTDGLAMRELRLELYAGAWEDARALLDCVSNRMLRDVCHPFDSSWVAEFADELREAVLTGILTMSLARLEPADEALAMLEAEPDLNDSAHRVLVEQLLFRGRLDDAEARLAGRDSVESDTGRACLLLLRGRLPESIVAYEAALARYLKQAGRRTTYFPERAGLFFVVALMAEGSAQSRKRAAAVAAAAAQAKEVPFQECYRQFSELLALFAGDTEQEDLLFLVSEDDLTRRDSTEVLLHSAALLWGNLSKGTRPPSANAELRRRLSAARRAGYQWYATQAAAVLAGPSKQARDAPSPNGGVSLARLVAPPERWPEAIDALLEIASPKISKKPESSSPIVSDRRLVWVLCVGPYGTALEPREQTSKKGRWSKGRPVALKRLFEGAQHLSFLTETDRAACALIETETTYEYGRYARVSYSLNCERALLALCGSDTVLIEEAPGIFEPCEIRRAAPRLEVLEEGAQLSVVLAPSPRSKDEIFTSRLASARSVEVIEFSPVHHAIARVLGRRPLMVPSVGRARLRVAIESLAKSVEVHSDLSGGPEGDVAESPGEPRPCFVLRALGDGLSVAPQVRPMGPDGPSVRPGQGGTTVLAHVAGRPARALRDFGEERRRLESVLAACPTLSAARSAGADFVLSSREGALEALVELRALGDDATLEWPDGEVLKVSDAIGTKSLSLSITSDTGGFLVQGALSLSGRSTLELAKVIDYLSASPGRFLQLAGEEQYLALTAELRERLQEVLNLSDGSKGGLRFHALTAPLVAELLASARIKSDAGWRRQIQRFKASDSEVSVPSTFRGELRPYQLEGFQWLVRLGRWGAGGCLADDMGLGKTVQTIALLLHRAPEGPALVVAPTSVVPTWIDEIGRFAPTLKVRVSTGAARAKALQRLGPFDLLVTSYNLVQNDIADLEKTEFATAVLDEAQFIKNLSTKRARAAGRLQARLRVATTGTPIENRLEDLHGIFSFLNPNLLGSPQSFQRRFARPIEQRTPEAREWLRRLVAPFILRRTKTQVLPELPARIETTLRVPLELEEMALYETIRERAIADLSKDARRVASKGSGRMRIFAALTRLRLAASNARLVLPDANAPSAKLTALGELLDELLPNQHKVLVFSQFVSHLALIKELLEQRGVRYQYLDGDTPMTQRKAAVDAFQAGEGEVFLISLKAGGVGLNLTAADYVVHMDPWWNPAVEDQASDRAHRIGQTRPVTLYRIVACDTIEDRILALHYRKRALADGILEGSDLAGRMSEAELLDLIRGA